MAAYLPVYFWLSVSVCVFVSWSIPYIVKRREMTQNKQLNDLNLKMKSFESGLFVYVIPSFGSGLPTISNKYGLCQADNVFFLHFS